MLNALLLRDVQTRFGNRGGYIALLLWPFIHICFLLVVYPLSGRTTPWGDSMILFFATGLTPYMFFGYPSRFIMNSILQNRPLIAFPIVRVADLLIARIIMETINGLIVIVVTWVLLFFLGQARMPEDPALAVEALAIVWLLLAGWGGFNALITAKVPIWLLPTALFNAVLYLSSGILFVPALLPEKAQEIISWNPTVNCVQLFREAFYQNYPRSEIIPNITYPIVLAVCLLFGTLAGERFFLRRRLD